MKLDVPLIQQREGSVHCQVASLLMVMAYFGDHIEYDALLAELEPYMFGTGMHNQGTAIFMQKRGYQTFFAHHDLGVVSPEIENITEKDAEKIEKVLDSTPDDEKNAYRKEKLTLDLEYIKAGGKYSTTLPKLEDVDMYLEKQIPVILGAVRNKGLHLNPVAKSANHAIVIVGKEGDYYFVNDPAPSSSGEYKIHKDRLLHAWYNAGAQIRVAWK